MKIEISRNKLRDALIEHKGISNTKDADPFVGIYFEDLYEILKKFEE